MPTLKEIIKEYAEENDLNPSVLHIKAIDIISKRYAKAKLEEAAERAMMIEDGTTIEIDKDSITNTPLD